MEKLELLKQIEEKQVDLGKLAETIELNPQLLQLYMIHDAYPVPKRILQKISDVMAA